MGTFRVPIEIGDPQGDRFERVEALVDTGASYSVLPASVLRQLEVTPHDHVTFILIKEMAQYPGQGIPVGIEQDPSLLLHHTRVSVDRIETHDTVAAFLQPPAVFVDDASRPAGAEIVKHGDLHPAASS